MYKPFFLDDTEYTSNNPLIIAELGTSHNGDLIKAKEMIKAAGEAGAACIKLQMVFADEILHENTGEVSLPGGRIRLYDRFKQLEMPNEFYWELKEYIESLNLLFLCTPFGLKSAKILKEMRPKAVKIASPELNYTALLREISSWGLPILLSTGVSTLGDIEEALSVLGNREWGMGNGVRGLNRLPQNIYNSESNDGNTHNSHTTTPIPYSLFPIPQVCLLHCVTAYPAPETDYNLRLLPNLSAIFGVATGLSDHSLDPRLVPVLAITQGAAVIEKHFCLSREDTGLDDPIALPPAEFALMVKAVKQAVKLGQKDTLELMIKEYGQEKIEAVLGSGIKKISPSENDNYARTKRSIHALHDIKAGEIIKAEDFAILRTEKILRPGLPPSWAEKICGRTARNFISAGEGIRFEDV